MRGRQEVPYMTIESALEESFVNEATSSYVEIDREDSSHQSRAVNREIEQQKSNISKESEILLMDLSGQGI